MKSALFLALCLSSFSRAAETPLAPSGHVVDSAARAPEAAGPLSPTLPGSSIPGAVQADVQAGVEPGAKVGAERLDSGIEAAPVESIEGAAGAAATGASAQTAAAQSSESAGEGEASSGEELFDRAAERAGLPSRLSGLGTRGLLGHKPAQTPETDAAAQNIGALWWYTKIFFVPNEQAAIEQEKLSEVILDISKPEDKRVPNVHLRALYMIDPSVTIQGAGHDKADFAKIAASMPDRPLYQVSRGTLVQLDPALVKERLSPALMAPMVQFKEEGAHVRAFGWHFSNPNGAFLLDDMDPAKSRTFKKLEADARARFYPAPKDGKPATERLVVTFNRDLKGVMEGARNQDRKGQDKSANRVNDGLIKTFLDMEKAGKTMSVELWKETALPEGGTKRELIAGVFGTNIGGMVSINSIYYGDEPDLARFTMLALRDRLKEAGIKFMPAAMISPWSATLKGKLIPAKQAVELIDSRPADAKPDFTTEWGPQAEPKIRNRPFGFEGKPVPDGRR